MNRLIGADFLFDTKKPKHADHPLKTGRDGLFVSVWASESFHLPGRQLEFEDSFDFCCVLWVWTHQRWTHAVISVLCFLGIGWVTRDHPMLDAILCWTQFGELLGL